MMTKIWKYTLAAALMVVCSCVENKSWDDEPSISTNDGDKSFNLLATPYTRAVVGQEDYSVEWTAGDKVSLLDGQQNREFVTLEGGSMAKFSGYASAADAYYAVYPYNASASLTDDVLSFEFPQQQTEAAGSIPNPLSTVWVGKSRGSLVVMNNLCATVMFSFAQEDVTSVTVSSNGSEKLSGPAYVTFENDNPVITLSQMTGETVVLTPAEGDVFTAGTHAVALMPGDFQQGLSLTFARADGQQPVVKKINTVSALAAASVVDLGTLDLDAPELKGVSVSEAVATGSGATLNGSMEIVRFKADRVSCGFEYRLAEEDPWTSVTCQTSAESFSYTLKGMKYSTEPVSYRSWAMVDGYKLYSDDVKTFTMLPPYTAVFNFIVPEEDYKVNTPILGASGWNFGTNGKVFKNKTDEEKIALNNTDWTYPLDDKEFLFRFWCRITHSGFCTRAITRDKDLPTQYATYHGICLNYSNSGSTDGYPSWVLLPSLENARLIKAELSMYDPKSKMTFASAVTEEGFPVESPVIQAGTSENANYGYLCFECPDSEFSKRYYLTSVMARCTISAMTLTYQYE